jgi:hypothetical protein
MAAINRVHYHPPPSISFCEGPRIIQKLIDVVILILELPLYILPSLAFSTMHISKLLEQRLFAYVSCSLTGSGQLEYNYLYCGGAPSVPTVFPASTVT